MKRMKLNSHPWLGICLTVLAFGAAADVLPPRIAVVTLDIRSQPIGDALNEFGRQSGIQILLYSEVANGLTGPALVGAFTADEALMRLLANTGLTYSRINERTVAVHRAVGTVSEDKTTREEAALPVMRLVNYLEVSEESKNEVVQETDPHEMSRQSSSGERRNRRIEEVIVTAQKREERLIDVPQSMSVLFADDLAKSGVVQLRDFANTVPGLSFTTAGAGFTQISLRGVTVGTDVGPTVGIYVDEVPYGGSTIFSVAARATLDVGLFDLDRVEVLRGPQGTLYGASTMGGLIKYVTKRPDATRFGVDAQTGISATHDGGVSYNGSIAVNAPIVADKAGLRASGFYSRDGGYIDNLALAEKDANRSDIYGGRADILLNLTDAFAIRVAAFLQEISRDGEGTANFSPSGVPLDGSLDQRRPFAEPFDQQFRLLSGTLIYDADWASLTSTSSYQTARSDLVWDVSSIYVPLLATAFGRAYSAVSVPAEFTTDKFTQEVRLASKQAQSLEWLIGGFYIHEQSRNEQVFNLRNLAGQPAQNDLFTIATPSRYEEYAAFGDLTWHLTSKFNVTGGIRYARNHQTFEQIGTGILGRSAPASRSTDDVLTYLANARYHFSDHAVGYLRYATGYRPGGPNFVNIDATTGLPVGEPTFDADQLKSYEAGFKAETANRRFGVDVAIYDIDWTNIQLTVTRGGFAAVDNAPGGASVRGAELTLAAHPTPGFAVTGAFAYQDAELSAADPVLRAAKGARLPNVPRLTAALNADYELPVWSLKPTVGATIRYVDDRVNGFGSTAYRLPDYATVDLRTGFTLERVNIQLYVRNFFDERGQLSLMQPQFGGRVAILQPRTIGLSATTHF